ncbi:MAG: triose-phosphate isomerase [Moraxellaceae bacterium]|nr:triose-phosphate isomerase [Pseudomonadales bacterium]MCB1674251.1 triose-phosphate isomerase [Pseudomonadales bacterium]MCP5173803.1 triose-phosphate isomerase [Moraxellaceae bacterium]MCP5176878.1 triose-phosphate isomerase [Moraxellaceae bacterium]HQV21781.1 triose-phosphate isomerase [Agitococcus sp.]
MSRKPLIVGNWKMNGSFAKNTNLLASLSSVPNVNMVVAPPAVYLASVSAQLMNTSIVLAAQNVAAEGQQGAYTGEVSAVMLAELGARYAIVGHSERRQYYGETDTVVAKKCLRLQEAGLRPIICVGETLAEREAGQVETVVSRQLKAIIDNCGIDLLAQAVVAYEPVWAIGTGKTATPADAQAVHGFLRQLVTIYDKNIADNLSILYGGSVKADNAASLFAMPDIDGALVGGASLVANEFLAICHAANASFIG